MASPIPQETQNAIALITSTPNLVAPDYVTVAPPAKVVLPERLTGWSLWAESLGKNIWLFLGVAIAVAGVWYYDATSEERDIRRRRRKRQQRLEKQALWWHKKGGR